MRHFAVSAWLLVACSHPTVTPAPVGTQPTAVIEGPDCARAATAVVDALHETGATRADMVVVIQRHCVDDHWTADARTCIATATTHDDELKCAYKHLTEEQHDQVQRAMKSLMAANAPVVPPTPTPPAPPPPDDPPPPPPKAGSQAEIAARVDNEGRNAMFAGNYAVASAKFREAVARVPDPRYFFNLCTSLYQEGKFDEALTACGAADRNKPSDALHKKIESLTKKVKDEAKAQGIQLRQ